MKQIYRESLDRIIFDLNNELNNKLYNFDSKKRNCFLERKRDI